MLLNEREIKILEKFYNQKKLSISELSEQFNISERMIRYNIDKINIFLKFMNISSIKKDGKGIFHLKTNSSKLLEFIKELEPIDKSKRIKMIEFFLSFYEKINISFLAKYFQITRITINSDLKEIEKKLKKYSISLENKNGLILKSSKENIFKYKIELLMKNIEDIISKEKGDYILKLKNILFHNIEIEIEIIDKFIQHIINKYNLKLDDLSYKLFYSKMIYILVEKEVVNNSIEYFKNYTNDEIVLILSEYFKNLNLSENKILEIIGIVNWIKLYENHEISQGKWFNMEIIARDIIKNVEKEISLNISEDKLLLEFLIQHLKTLIHRIKNGYKIDKIDLEEKIEDKLYFTIKNSLKIINNIVGASVDEDEIHLLKIHFLASIERMSKLRIRPVEIAIITSFGSASNKILIDNIRSKFLVKVVYIGAIYKLNEILEKYPEIKYILTTIDLEKFNFVDKEVIKINPILTIEDKLRLEKLGFRTNNNKINLSELIELIKENSKNIDEKRLIDSLLNNFPDKLVNDILINKKDEDILLEKNILFDYEAINIEEAIIKACSLLENEYIKSSYTEEVLKIFNENNKHIIRYNGIILPHTKNNNNVFKDGISILNLKNSVYIENEKINTVVVFVIKDEKNISNYISNVINKVFKNKFLELLKNKDKKEIIKFLEE